MMLKWHQALVLTAFFPSYRLVAGDLTQSVMKLTSFPSQGKACTISASGASGRRGSAVLVRMPDNQLALVTSAHVPFQGTVGQGLCHVASGPQDEVSFDLLAVNDLMDIAVLVPVGQVPQAWRDAALPFAQMKAEASFGLGTDVTMIGYPFSSDRPAAYQGHVDLLESVRSTLVGTRVTEVTPVASSGAIASEFGMSGGASFAVAAASQQKIGFMGLITAQYLDYPNILPQRAQVVERSTTASTSPLKTLLLPASTVWKYLEGSLAKPMDPSLDIRQSLNAQRHGEHTIQFSGLAFTELHCPERTVLEGRHKDAQASHGGASVGGANGGGVGGSVDDSTTGTDECTVQITAAATHEPQNPWPFAASANDIASMKKDISNMFTFYIAGTTCPGEAEPRAIQNLRSLFYELGRGCGIIFQNIPTDGSPTPGSTDELFAKKDAESLRAIAGKEKALALGWSQLQPATRRLFWGNMDEEAKRELALLVATKSSNLALKKELDAWRRDYSLQLLKVIIMRANVSDDFYVRSSYARRFWLMEAAANSNDQAFYSRIFALSQKYPSVESDQLFSIMFDQTMRDGIWKLYTSPRQSLGSFEVTTEEFETTITLPQKQQVNALALFSTIDCPVVITATPEIVAGTPDSSDFTLLTAFRDSYQEAFHLLALEDDIYITKIHLLVKRDMSVATTAHGGKCMVGVQTTDARIPHFLEAPQIEQAAAAFAWTQTVKVPTAERTVADGWLQSLFDVRILHGQRALLLQNKERLN